MSPQSNPGGVSHQGNNNAQRGADVDNRRMKYLMESVLKGERNVSLLARSGDSFWGPEWMICCLVAQLALGPSRRVHYH